VRRFEVELTKARLLMPEDLDEKLERETQDFVARLETWLADRPALRQALPSAIDVNNAEPVTFRGGGPAEIKWAAQAVRPKIGTKMEKCVARCRDNDVWQH